jgi:hypothetical protein
LNNDKNVNKYIDGLKFIFDEYEHIQAHTKALLYPTTNCILLHIHTINIEEASTIADLIAIVKLYIQKGILVYITVHNYQWLFPGKSNPRTQHILSNKPKEQNVLNANTLFSLVNKVIYPSAYIRKFYIDAFKSIKNWIKDDKNIVIAHVDMLVSHDNIRIPPITSGLINIAYLGEYNKLNNKKSQLISSISRKLKKSKSKRQKNVKEKFLINTTTTIGHSVINHVLIDTELQPVIKRSDQPVKMYSNIVYHKSSSYSDLKVFLARNNIHIIAFLSAYPEAYSYTLSHAINSGLCIAYLSDSVYADKLHPDFSPRYIPISNSSGIAVRTAIREAIKYTIKNAGVTSGYAVESNNIQPNRWYYENYPIPVF